MQVRRLCCFLALSPFLLLSLHAQLKRGPVGPDGIHAPHSKPTNLQVLPPDITIPDLIGKMIMISQGLGVQCNFCHMPKPGVDPEYDLDFPSDANPHKVKARIMLRMTEDINQKYLAQITPHEAGPMVCGNCHQGQPLPPAYKTPPGYVLK